MAAPVYASDLTTINDGSGTFTEPTGATLGSLSNADTDNFIQGTNCCTKSTGASGAPALAGAGFLAAAGQTITSPSAFYAWLFVGAGALTDTYANGGIRLIVGSSSANYYSWSVLGGDTFPYVGWTCIAVETDTGVVPADYTQGTPTATKQYFGVNFNCLINIGKGNPMGVDALRHGRTLTVTFGEVSNYATFSGIASQNDTTTNRWGQFQAIPGGYQLQGRLLLGVTGGNIVDFRDSNVNLVTAVSLKVAPSFNAIEIQNASSRVDWDSVSWSALGTVSRGTFTVTDNADVNITGCSFTGLSTFSLLSGTDILNTIFRSCDTVTAPGSNLTGSSFLTPRVATDTSAVIWNVATDPDGKLDNTTFSKGTNAHHAIEFGTSSPTTMTLNGISFTGFSASLNNDASIFHIKRTTGTVTINLVGCSSDVSFATSYRTDGATVVIVQDPVTFSVTVKDLDTGLPIQNARVIVPVTNGTNFPYLASVTITGSGTTATVTHTAHGLATNDNVLIAGATQDEYNGAYTITVTGTNSYTYTTPATVTATPATGTLTSTMVLLNGLTDASGVITDSRTYSGVQPVSGWARKATGSPLYRQAPITDIVDESLGLSVTVFLQPDE